MQKGCGCVIIWFTSLVKIIQFEYLKNYLKVKLFKRKVKKSTCLTISSHQYQFHRPATVAKNNIYKKKKKSQLKIIKKQKIRCWKLRLFPPRLRSRH